jgi:hypothetical protein
VYVNSLTGNCGSNPFVVARFVATGGAEVRLSAFNYIAKIVFSPTRGYARDDSHVVAFDPQAEPPITLQTMYPPVNVTSSVSDIAVADGYLYLADPTKGSLVRVRE